MKSESTDLTELAKELSKQPDFINTLAKEMERVAYKRELREWIKDVREEIKILSARKKRKTGND